MRTGEAAHGAREAAASAQVDVWAALAWRDFMVSNYSDAGQQHWLESRGIDLLRGAGKLVGTGVVEVDGVRHTAEHLVVATGTEPIVPRVPGLRDLEGVWGTREATSKKSVPRRLLALGGGAAGVELAQVVRRLGGEALRRDGIELILGKRATAARREGDEYVLSYGATGCSSQPAAARASPGSAWIPSACG